MEYLINWATDYSSPSVLAGLVIVLMSISLAVFGWLKKPVLIFSLGLFWLPLLPVSGIFIPANGLFYEHWLYLPLVGFFLTIYFILEFFFEIYFKKLPEVVKYLILIIFIFYLGFLSCVTILRNMDYQNPETFYNNILQYNQTSLRVWNNLGMLYGDQKRWPESIEAYQKAITLDTKSESWVPRHNLANSYKNLGQVDLAITNYQDAISKSGSSIPPYLGLAQLYLDQNQPDKSIQVLEDALLVSPNNSQLLETIAILKQQNANLPQSNKE